MSDETQELPYHNKQAWLQLDKAKGLDHSKNYDNMTAATCFMEFISLTEREKVIDILSEINFFSLTMNGSTDDSVTEQETIFYLLEPVFREKLPQDLCVLPLVNPNQPALKICLPL